MISPPNLNAVSLTNRLGRPRRVEPGESGYQRSSAQQPEVGLPPCVKVLFGLGRAIGVVPRDHCRRPTGSSANGNLAETSDVPHVSYFGKVRRRHRVNPTSALPKSAEVGLSEQHWGQRATRCDTFRPRIRPLPRRAPVPRVSSDSRPPTESVLSQVCGSAGRMRC